jgi:pimeloyl-ACP methyl ester carboxylesterase
MTELFSPTYAESGRAEQRGLDTQHEGPKTVGRFRENNRARLLRTALRTLEKCFPALAAQVGYQLLARPPRVAERDWQAAIRQCAKLTFVEASGKRIAIYTWGADSRPTVLMVHGWGGRATHMGHMIAPLVEAGFRVVAFDAPAHGASTGKTTDLIEFAGAVARVMKYTGPIHTLISHSFGAAMAMMAVRDWNVSAERYVLISAFDHCNWFCKAFGEFTGLSQTIIARMKTMMVERYNDRLDWDSLSVTDMLRATRQPALLIHDEDDREIPFHHSVRMLRGAPNADLHVTQGLGHHRLLGNRGVIARVVSFVGAADPLTTYEVARDIGRQL